MAGYDPEEYEALKDFYKKDLRERKAILEHLRLKHLRQKAEWHLKQVETSLQSLGIDSSQESASEVPPSESSDKTLL